MWDGTEWLVIGRDATALGTGDYGDGSDGFADFDGTTEVIGTSLSGSTYTLSRDVYYTNMTVLSGITVAPGGFRIYGTGQFTNAGTISRNGVAGTAGASGGAGGTAIAESGSYLRGSLAGGAGGASATAGTAGGSRTNSIGSYGVAGGDGGAGSAASGGTGGAGGTAFPRLVAPIDKWNVKTLLDIGPGGSTVKYDNSAAGGGGGGGGTGSGGAGGVGGGAGSCGGIIAIYFLDIVNEGSGVISATGGSGGAGQTAPNTNAGGGGGGAGGNGGQIFLIYNTLTNRGSITATAGTGGAGGAGDGTGSAGSSGTDGTDGTVHQFEYSL